MEAVRNEDLVFMELAEADAIIRQSVARLVGGHAAVAAAEKAFDLLLRIIAYGLHDSRRSEAREEAKGYMAEFRAAVGTCANCGHEPHDPRDAEQHRQCPNRPAAGTLTLRCSCSAIRDDDGTTRYRF